MTCMCSDFAICRRVQRLHKGLLNFCNGFSLAFDIVGTMASGVVMCFSMVWGRMILGVLLGLAGIDI